MKKLPIAIQSFKEMRSDDYIYIDKTEHIYNLTQSGKYYFLSRPRRFGKSLLIDTIHQLFEGREELFEGLFIYNRWDWSRRFPVIHLDFSKQKAESPEELAEFIYLSMKDIARENGIEIVAKKYYKAFDELIKKLSEKNKVVLLIDEYDKPIIDNIEDVGLAKGMREI
ncbi:MAG: AAA family ATPase, partial [Myxococcota bacterium]